MRVRFRFSKMGKVRFTSHRDVARMWERAVRRTRLPIAYSEGFSPRPKMSFGLALPTGGESFAEFVDIDILGDDYDVDEMPDVDELPPRLSPLLPLGIDVSRAVMLEGPTVSLQADVLASSWIFQVGELSLEQAHHAVAAALAAEELMVSRDRKGAESCDDVRPAIESLEVAGPAIDGHGVTLRARTLLKPRGLRPGELTQAVFADAPLLRVLRTHQWIERNGARVELLPLDATPIAPTFAVVSA
jgi:radical SAM-linked protein